MDILISLSGRHSKWLKHSKSLGLAIRPLLEALVTADQLYLRMQKELGSPVPPLYRSGVRYRPEPPGTIEEFAAIPVVLARGWGDCDDLAPWRVAELREHGEAAKIRIQWKRHFNRRRKRKEKLFHIVVRRADGSIEDPSRRLGMR